MPIFIYNNRNYKQATLRGYLYKRKKKQHQQQVNGWTKQHAPHTIDGSN
jgi:hypothetical protein